MDVQNDFCAEGGAMQSEGRDISMAQAMVPRLACFVDAARSARVPLVWIRSVFNNDPNWYLSEVWLEQATGRRNGLYVERPVCQRDAWNGDFYQVRPRPDEVIVTKNRYGSFEGTDLDLVLRSRRFRTVVMTGVTTNVCVETTAPQAFLKDYHVVFTSDCTAAYAQSDHEATLRNIDNYFGQVVRSDEVVACWQPAPALAR